MRSQILSLMLLKQMEFARQGRNQHRKGIKKLEVEGGAPVLAEGMYKGRLRNEEITGCTDLGDIRYLD